MEALQCRIRDEHQKWKIEEELLEIKEIEELNPLGERYSTSPAQTQQICNLSSMPLLLMP